MQNKNDHPQNDHPKHFIYGLYCDDELYYIGYSNRPLEERLREHIYTALNPTHEQSINDGVRGKNDKRKVIQTAIDEGFELTIRCLEERYTYEPLDEEFYINEYRNKGHLLTNVATGSVWQPHCLVRGELVETVKEVNGAELRQDIHEFKIDLKSRPKKPKKPVDHTPTKLNQEEYDQWIDRLWLDRQKFYKRQGKGNSIDRQALYDEYISVLVV